VAYFTHNTDTQSKQPPPPKSSCPTVAREWAHPQLGTIFLQHRVL